MKVFLDECVPRPLGRLLEGHQCQSALEMGWAGLKNGHLLEEVESSGFEVFLTSDQNLGYQQNLEGRHIAIIVLPTNHWPILRSRVQDVLKILDGVPAGSFRELRF